MQGDASSPDRDAKHAKLTRSKVRDRDNIEPVEAPAKGKRGRKAQKLEPVTEAYTQFDDGFEGDDQLEEMIVIGNQETERQDTQTSDEIFIHNSRGAVAAAQNLRTAREEYTRKHRGDDPLLSVLEASPAAVVSRAVGSKKVTTPISSLTASSCEPMSKKKSPLKRASIITARATAEQV